jgi:hypothetical protein
MNTNREVFDYMRGQMSVQHWTYGPHSRSGSADSTGRNLVYYRGRGSMKNPTNYRRCPVGHLIPDALYETVRPNPYKGGKLEPLGRQIEGFSVLTPDVQAVVTEALGWSPDWHLLHDVQCVHDYYSPILWAREMARVEREWFGPGMPYGEPPHQYANDYAGAS